MSQAVLDTPGFHSWLPAGWSKVPGRSLVGRQSGTVQQVGGQAGTAASVQEKGRQPEAGTTQHAHGMSLFQNPGGSRDAWEAWLPYTYLNSRYLAGEVFILHSDPERQNIKLQWKGCNSASDLPDLAGIKDLLRTVADAGIRTSRGIFTIPNRRIQ